MAPTRWLLATLGLSALALLAACGFQAELELDLTFQPLGGVPLECAEAGVDTVVVSFFESLEEPPLSRIRRSCRAWRHQALLVDPGPMSLRVQAYDANGALCYEDTRRLDFGRRDDHELEWIVLEHTDGRANGCVYP
jgi:hypothetical protein